MSFQASVEAATVVRRFVDGLHRIGYSDSLIHRNYRFARSQARPEVLTVPVAAFGSEPPSYRTACHALVVAEEVTPESLVPFRDLGAPQLFSYDLKTTRFSRWRTQAAALPVHLETINTEEISVRLVNDRDAWGPAAVLRLKVAEAPIRPAQIDFFDVGLLPLLEHEVQGKLDALLGEVVAQARDEWFNSVVSPSARQAASLFRLVFRLLAFKLLLDRGSELSAGVPLDQTDAVLSAVRRFYPELDASTAAMPPKRIADLVWSKIRDSLRLENLSVEALAYVYENTMVSARQRHELGTHATPWRVAEYIIRSLPLEMVPADKRTVCEPFAGHAPFIVTALARLKALSEEGDIEKRHRYLVRMLSAIEVDPFAAEVARYSLMLADYPATNGWRIFERDLFADSPLPSLLSDASAIVSNPPFEDFDAATAVGGTQHYNKATAALQLFLEASPPMLGLVLPQAFIDGKAFRRARKQIADQYQNTQVIWLPDMAFAHASAEAAVVIASREAPTRWKGRTSVRVTPAQYRDFDCGEAPLPVGQTTAQGSTSLWRPPLSELWSALEKYPRVGELVADASRGIEYTFSLRTAPNRAISKIPRKNYRLGVLSTTGSGFAPYEVSRDQLVYLNVSADLQRRMSYMKPWDNPKVLVNAQRKSRGMWPLVAVPDDEGLVVYQNVTALWSAGIPVEVLAAILNGPVANAYVALHNAKRHIRKETIMAIPSPRLSSDSILRLVQLVKAYRVDAQHATGGQDRFHIVQQVDEILLRAYALAPRLERELLLSFASEPRPGLAHWHGYYDEAKPPAISWHLYKSARLKSSTAANLRAFTEPVANPSIGAALEYADLSLEHEE